ncbi:MAG: putative sugar O-methyltransferase [Burkholderiales bacterium]|nr:putative sugar O-methyltransferase [Burkholderiales bacterium]
MRPPLTAHKFLAAHYANLLLPSLPVTGKTTYVEIGPGSGYLATLVHHHRPGRLILIDLPEILPYSFLLLQRTFPDVPFVLPNELAGDPVRLPEEGFVFMTSDQATRLPDHCMDIGVNTASFGEMLPGLVEHYFTLLRRIVRPDGLFFTCNRIEKWMDEPGSSSSETARPPKHCLRFESYPWSPLDRDLFYGQSAFHDLVQPQNPMMHRLCHLAPQSTAAKPS